MAFGKGLAARRSGAGNRQRGWFELALDPDSQSAQGEASDEDGGEPRDGPAKAQQPLPPMRLILRPDAGGGGAQPFRHDSAARRGR